MDNFANTRNAIISSIGVPAAMKLLEGSLFPVVIGANDFLDNYLVPVVSTIKQKLVTPETFVGALISRFRLQLTVKLSCYNITILKRTQSNNLFCYEILITNLGICNISQRLYNMGARRILVANVGPIGCIPFERDINPSAGENCVAFPNQLAQLFNSQLKDLIAELSTNLSGSKFVYGDVYHIVDDILRNYISFGVVLFCSLFSFFLRILSTDVISY